MKIFTFQKATFIIFAFLYLFITIILVNMVTPNFILGLDMRAFYTSGLMVNHGVVFNFYDFSTQYFWQKTIFPLPAIELLMPFFNPPFVALIFSPLALLPVKNAYVVFSVLNIFISLITFHLIISKVYKKAEKSKYFLSLAFILFFFPVWMTIIQGQLSFLILLGFVASWYLFKQERSFLAGVAIALLWVRPQLILLPLLFLIFKKQWRAFLGLCVASVILGLISVYVVGIAGVISYMHVLSNITSLGDSYTVHPQLEPTLRGFLQTIFRTNILSDVIIPLIIGMFLAFSTLVFSFRGKFEPKTTKFDLQWGMLIVAVILTSLHTNFHDLVFLIFPCLILLRLIKKFPASYLFVQIICLWLLLIVNIPSLSAILLLILLLVFARLLLKNNIKVEKKH